MRRIILVISILSAVCITLTQTIQCQSNANAPLSAEKIGQGGGVMLPYTPVKDQEKTSACWIYAYLACVETERIEHYGDSMNLSPYWMIYHMLKEQAAECYLTQGKKEITERGIGPEAERLLKEYGIVPWSNFKPSDGINSSVMVRSLSAIVKTSVHSRKGLTAVSDATVDALPHLPHNLHDGFYLYGAHYTPQEFARSLLNGITTEWLTSYTHHAFNEPFVLEVPDNTRLHKVMNVPIDTLFHKTIAALKHHHPVFWEGEMEYKKYSISHNTNVQEKRQKAFETFQVRDQHAMAIIGLTKDKNGDPILICKNSWGKEWGKNGFHLMSKEEFLINTVMVGVMGE